MTLPPDPVMLPLEVELFATIVAAMSGALVALRRGYDTVGLFALAFITATGGGVLRDGLFLQNGPPAVTRDPRFVIAVAVACVAAVIVGLRVERHSRLIAVLDAVGLSAYAVVGVNKAMMSEMSPLAAILVGVISACGGGVMRDVIVREEPLLFKPGQFYALAALTGAVFYAGLVRVFQLAGTQAAFIAMTVAFILRVLAIRYNWQTIPLVRTPTIPPPHPTVSPVPNAPNSANPASADSGPREHVPEVAPEVAPGVTPEFPPKGAA
ncbi:Putative membrane protein OS=Desulfovibrio magneticus str. Maddingley MBC34 GN=B193_2724 PE=4 SV=1: UPF0126: UPF0126 [Tuwongella immobilis]|uniref:Glycine transporter domain-containing protein n=2 Tax=Tuwongella immobilis TaxID=692036 RepID=A0A6C2YIT2_9BACT|nr:Putative membrane protein OS=Desulfovibrio magneticus str. Maddingley MBC34 GN=B193_2724 PE=4 SV=1: UPF0126: UPF0126 [Tuwongella immobilis]VTR97974.1 Putative membrane protein OS=Desulfovibrio magneticus str. Maddingley MBC34 GN=B193_2724 PE=4 SV=1: UPF0126: UPF0126 [Tuwongella immobilis]